MRIASVGHGVFAAFMIGIGILGLVQPQYAAIWDGIPKALPGRELLPYLCALVALACGLGLLWPRSAGVAARVLLAYLLVWMILFKGRFIVLAPTQEGSYQSAGENAVIVAGAWVLYAWLAVDWDKNRLGFATGDRGVRIARVFYGLALIAFGLSHFFYLQFTAPLIPSWLLWPVFWAYFTGAAYLAAGAAVHSGVHARLAAT
ncbi:MAG: DoxX family protein, partial [Gammaproteobacteria bacterium]